LEQQLHSPVHLHDVLLDEAQRDMFIFIGNKLKWLLEPHPKTLQQLAHRFISRGHSTDW
jgi:hypothetical protein